MKSLCIAFTALALFHGSAHADTIDQLSWLAGCWLQEGREAGSMEMWTPAAAGTLLGVSRTVKNRQSVAHEFMQIRATPDGAEFIAQPSNQTETTFRAIRASAEEIVFENLQHDFPQRVIYRRTAANSLMARIEGTREGKLQGVDFPMKRMKCEAL